MKKLCIAVTLSLLAAGAYAATKTPAATPATAPITDATPAQKTSALFYSTCAQSLGQESEFNKSMQTLADAKTAVKMAPDKLAGMVNDKEKQNAWGVKGFADPKKPLLLTYNGSENICGMHVSDIAPEDMRHAFQADLKKLVDLDKANIKVYKPQTNGDMNVFVVDVVSGGKTLQLGIAISTKSGEEFLTAHM